MWGQQRESCICSLFRKNIWNTQIGNEKWKNEGKTRSEFQQTFLNFVISSYKVGGRSVHCAGASEHWKLCQANKSFPYHKLKPIRWGVLGRGVLGKLLPGLLFLLPFWRSHSSQPSREWLLPSAERLPRNISTQIRLFSQRIWRNFDQFLGRNVCLWRWIGVFLVMVSWTVTQRKWFIANAVIHVCPKSHMRLQLVRC